MRLRSGYTWIDLIVTVLIALVLAAVLFPIFAQPRVNRSRRSCITNVKQLATGMMMYLQDSDEVFPPGNAALAPERNWDDLVLPYVKNERLFRCLTMEVPPANALPVGRVRGYAHNANIFGRRQRDAGKHAPGLDYPATTVMLCEAHYRVRGSRSNRQYKLPDALTAPDGDNEEEQRDGWKPLGQPGAIRHTGKSNYAFADGHVKPFAPEAVRSAGVPNSGKQPSFEL